jgi:hypothetical protein
MAFIGGCASWDSQGYLNTDRRAGFTYIAIGMSPAMVEKHIGAGSQYLWTPKPFPSVSTYTDPQSNSDGSIDVYFGPKPSAGKEKNWIQTTPGKGWFTLFRFYGPLEPFFDKTWRPDDIQMTPWIAVVFA